MKRTFAALAAAGALVAVLAGCAAEPSAPTPSPSSTYHDYIGEAAERRASGEPEPNTVVEPEPTAAAPAEPLVFEALGEGPGHVMYSRDGGMVRKSVELPFSVELGSGHGTPVGVVLPEADQSIGCRITQGDTVVDEVEVVEGQYYAECLAE